MPSDSSYVLKEATSQKEFDALFMVVWLAEHHPYEPAGSIFFPVFGATAADRDDTIQKSQIRLWKEHKSNPASHWLYVEDVKTGEIVGATEWEVHEKNPFPDGSPKLDAYWWPEGEGR